MLEQEFAMPCILEDSVRAIAFDLPPFFAHGIIRHFLHSGLRLRTAEPVKRSRPQPPSSLSQTPAASDIPHYCAGVLRCIRVSVRSLYTKLPRMSVATTRK